MPATSTSPLSYDPDFHSYISATIKDGCDIATSVSAIITLLMFPGKTDRAEVDRLYQPLTAAIPNMGAYLNEADPYVYPQSSTQW